MNVNERTPEFNRRQVGLHLKKAQQQSSVEVIGLRKGGGSRQKRRQISMGVQHLHNFHHGCWTPKHPGVGTYDQNAL